MHLILLLQVLFNANYAVQAFSWPGKQSTRSNTQHLEDTDNAIWHSGELSAVFDNHDKLESYARKPDCFRRVASSIRVQCGDLDMDEDERVQAAISMTICELATAKHTPPLECSSIISFSEDSATTQTPGADSCVEALSRSAQYWSSYSGYLREIPQLCHAFRRWNDIDMAKDVYRNASLEAISILRTVNDVEQRQHSFYEGIDEIGQFLRHLVQDMGKVNADIGESAAGAFRRLQTENEQAIALLKHTATSALESHSNAYNSLFQELSKEMQSVAREHAESLDLLIPALQATFEAQLTPALEETRKRFQDVNDIAFTAQSNWRAVIVEFGQMQEVVSSLGHTIADTVSVLDEHVDQAKLASRIQIETTDSAERLGKVLADLTTFTHLEMEKINDTAMVMHDQWLAAAGTQIAFMDWRQWSEWTHTFCSLLQIIFRVDSAVLDRIFGSSILQFAGLLCRTLWYLVYTGLASITSVLLLVASSRFWVFPQAKPSSPEPQEVVCPAARHAAPLRRSRTQLINCSPAASHSSLCSWRSQDRFSRIPDRLCRTPTE